MWYVFVWCTHVWCVCMDVRSCGCVCTFMYAVYVPPLIFLPSCTACLDLGTGRTDLFKSHAVAIKKNLQQACVDSYSCVKIL